MSRRTVLTAEEMARTMDRLVYEVLERHGRADNLVFVGIQRRGAELAERMQAIISRQLHREIPLGKLDINLYRDDWTTMTGTPEISRTEIPFDIDAKDVLLVDDVLFTGRTVRAALEAILDFGRPNRVELMVLVDRGHRELPINADFVGKRIETARAEHVDVLVAERDGHDEVVVSS
ncbi:MAG: bifunctional pyr operon transcriptional regulator/uracil phosphoribosyltransferase PyrR [Desulfovibrionales bacterium]